MAKRFHVRNLFDRLGFDCLSERGPNEDLRFMVTGVHLKRNIRVVVSAPNHINPKLRLSGKKVNRRHVKVELMDGACRPLPGVTSDVTVSGFCEVKSILEDVASGAYKVSLAS